MKKDKKELIKLIKSINVRSIAIENGLKTVDIEGGPIPYITETGAVQIVIHGYKK